MNSPIINPLYIYLLNLIEPAQIILGLLITIFSTMYITGFYISLVNEENSTIRPEIIKYFKNKKKSSLIIVIISVIMVSLLPGKDTIIQMYVASKITPQLVKDAVSTGKSFKDEIKKDIIDLLNYDKQDSTKSE